MKVNNSIALVVLSACAPKTPQPTAQIQSLPVVQVSSGEATTYQEYPASIEGAINIEIRPQVSGILDHVFVDEGAYVKAGEALFKINAAPFRERLNNARARLYAAEGALSNAQIEIEKLTPLVSPEDPIALTNLSDVHNVHVYFALGETDFIALRSIVSKR